MSLQAVAAHAVSAALYTVAVTSVAVVALGLALYYYWELTLFLLRCLHVHGFSLPIECVLFL